jgi:pyridoxal phosphate enzyme (YggS family)
METPQILRRRIEIACQRANRSPDSVTLIGASKRVEAARLLSFVDEGIRDFGENYIQEGVEKVRFLRRTKTQSQWHFIGALQSNKAREAVRYFDLIHSVDRASLARELDKEARKIGKTQRVLLQVNVGDEASKAGVSIQNFQSLVDETANLPNLVVEGLMSLPPFFEDAELMRPFHRKLRELGERFPIPILSMGMSGDFEVAIEEGATHIRVGTALFGSRG